MDYIKDNFLDFNILCFTETHLDNQVSTSDLFLSNSFDEPYRKDRTNHGGGLLLYPNAELVHTRRPDLEIYCEESLWVEITVRHKIFLLRLFYSPKTADSTFFNNLNLNIEKAYDFSNNIIIIGDLNQDLFHQNFHNLVNVLTTKAPISLGCDEFAMGLRIDSQIRRELSHGIAKASHASRTRRERFAKVLNM